MKTKYHAQKIVNRPSGCVHTIEVYRYAEFSCDEEAINAAIGAGADEVMRHDSNGCCYIFPKTEAKAGR